jgi:hypothetical protein
MVQRNGPDIELDPKHLHGIVFGEAYHDSEALIDIYREPFHAKGYTLFLLEQNFNINKQPDIVALVKTADKYQVLQQLETNGLNYDIDTDSVISIIKKFDERYSLDLTGAAGDYCQFHINNDPGDWLSFAKEVYEVCPDVVDQGTGTVEALANEMKATRKLYLWWD